MELDAARWRLPAARRRAGARPHRAALGRAATTSRDAHGNIFLKLTPRELQVLRCVAAGETNKAIAAGCSSASGRWSGT
jgi:DNA-binding NarL/FixJ family response regulator